MTTSGFREEVLNVILAQLLGERGVVSVPETIERWPMQGRRMPDVLVVFQGLRTVIEGKVGDQPDAEGQVLDNARGRVEQGIAHISIAVLYPASLRQAPSLDELKRQLSAATLRVAVCTEAGEQGWTECDLGTFADLLRRSFERLIREDVVAEAVAALDAGVERLARAISGTPAVVDRWADILGIREPRASGSE